MDRYGCDYIIDLLRKFYTGSGHDTMTGKSQICLGSFCAWAVESDKEKVPLKTKAGSLLRDGQMPARPNNLLQPITVVVQKMITFVSSDVGKTRMQ